MKTKEDSGEQYIDNNKKASAINLDFINLFNNPVWLMSFNTWSEILLVNCHASKAT